MGCQSSLDIPPKRGSSYPVVFWFFVVVWTLLFDGCSEVGGELPAEDVFPEAATPPLPPLDTFCVEDLGTRSRASMASRAAFSFALLALSSTSSCNKFN